MTHPHSNRRAGITLPQILIACSILIVLFSTLLTSPDSVIHPCLGWYIFLSRMSAEVRLDAPAILQFVLATAVFLGLTHYLARSFFTQANISANWRFRDSVLITLALFVSFAAGLSFVGTVHQVGWLAREPYMFSGGMQAHLRTQSRNNLKHIGIAAYGYHDEWNSFPVGGTLLGHAIPGHSWQTFLLPYMDQLTLFQKIDFHQPWFASQNKPHFTTRIPIFKSPLIESDLKDQQNGYALSHYAANSRLAGLGESISLDRTSISDGTSHTLFAGEVVSNFKPWADPTNRRDPTLGLNTSPQGFGGPWSSRRMTTFLLADGSVRYLSDNIDPKVLKALATPNGGEPVGEF